jgi:hypothetical protein
VNLETINALAQLIAAIGVIASLFYLAAQIRQNTRSMRAIVVDSLAKSISDVIRPAAEVPELMRAVHDVAEDYHNASKEDLLRSLPLLFSLFKLFENAWFQHCQGTLDPGQWQGWDAYIRMYFHRPGIQDWWQLRRAAFAPGFCNYLQNTTPVSDLQSAAQLIRRRS